MPKKYTLGELMTVDSVRQEKAEKSSVVLENTYHELVRETLLDRFRSFFGGKTHVQRYKIIFRFEVTSDTGNLHVVLIRVDPDFDLINIDKNQVEIYCDCADFKYRSAYLLNKRGSLFLNSSTQSELGVAINEAPKKITSTILCKHAFAALSWLVKNYTNVMKTI